MTKQTYHIRIVVEDKHDSDNGHYYKASGYWTDETLGKDIYLGGWSNQSRVVAVPKAIADAAFGMLGVFINDPDTEGKKDN